MSATTRFENKFWQDGPLETCFIRKAGRTYIQDSVSRTVPPPSLQLLMLCVLQPPVMENYTHNTLKTAQDSLMSREHHT